MVKLHPGGSGTGTSPPDQWKKNRKHSSHQPESPTIDMKISQVVKKYHNPDPLLRLIGPANEATIIVEGQRFQAPINSGAQLSMMLELLVQTLKPPIHQLNTLIETKVSGGGVVPYIGYVEARLSIPGIKAMDKDLLFMVSNDSPYMKRVPIQLGTLHTWESIRLCTPEEWKLLPKTWDCADFPPQAIHKAGTIKTPEFDLSQVKGPVKLTKTVTIAPFQTVHVSGTTKCDQNFKRVNVVVEPDFSLPYDSIVPIHGYTMLRPGSSRVSVGLRNISCCKITIQAKSVIAKVSSQCRSSFLGSQHISGAIKRKSWTKGLWDQQQSQDTSIDTREREIIV